LAKATPAFERWWANPRGPKDPYLALEERQAFVARVQEDDDKLNKKYPTVPLKGSSGAVLTNAGNDKDWKQRGAVALSYAPEIGNIRLQLGRVVKTYTQPADVVFAALEAIASDPRIMFAQCNVQQLVDGKLLLYSLDRTPFPHREFLGWMGYVPQQLTQAEVPDASRLERHGQGTLILSTPLLDLSDPVAVMQANKVEMSLVDLGLLPVTDRSLL